MFFGFFVDNVCKVVEVLFCCLGVDEIDFYYVYFDDVSVFLEEMVVVFG